MGHASFIRLAIVGFTLLALAGCGRRGPLELPPGSPQAKGNEAAAARQARVLQDQDQPGLIQSPDQFYEEPAAAKLEREQRAAAALGAPRAINAPPVPTKSTFLLDPLL